MDWYVPGAQPEYFREGTGFFLRGQWFPKGWAELATDSDREKIGMRRIVSTGEWGSDPEYWINGETLVAALRTLTKTARPLADCQAVAVRRVKRTAASMLEPSDWKVIRQQETGTPVDQITADYRSAIRTASNAHEVAINACSTVEELAALTFVWPEL